MTDGRTIDACISALRARPEASGAMTVWTAADDHPLRALQEGPDGWLVPYGDPAPVSSRRQDYPEVLYYDQGPWCFRPEWAERGGGPRPWSWVGPRVMPVRRPWVAGRDVHGPLDLWIADRWLSDLPERQRK